MVTNKRLLYGIGMAVIVIFLFGMFSENRYDVFSTVRYTDQKTCSEWIQTEKVAGFIPNSTTSAPFCWLKEGYDKRWISEMEETVAGCELQYTLGCKVTNCTSYCSTQIHEEECAGTWQSTGTFPKCSCNWICTSEPEPESGFSTNNLLTYLPWAVGILGAMAAIFMFIRRK